MHMAFEALGLRAGADIRTESGGWSGKKGGEMGVDKPGQHVLQRSSVIIDPQVRSIPSPQLSVSLPFFFPFFAPPFGVGSFQHVETLHSSCHCREEVTFSSRGTCSRF